MTATIESRYRDPDRSSSAEAKLADIIEQCYGYEPGDRASIFEIVESLRQALSDELVQQQLMNETD